MVLPPPPIDRVAGETGAEARRHSKGWKGLAVMAAALALVATACGTKSKPSATESTFCDNVVLLDAVSTPGGAQDPTSAEMKSYASQVTGPIGALHSNAPTTLAASVGTVVGAVDRAKAGDASALGDDFGTAKSKIESWTYDHCGFRRFTVTATDHGYGGIPGSLKAGHVAIRFRNQGKEAHLALWLKRPTADNRPALEVLGQSFEQLAKANFDMVLSRKLGFVDGEPAGAGPGQAGGSTIDLAPGSYIVFCPIGTGGNDTDPHYRHGMIAAVTVA